MLNPEETECLRNAFERLQELLCNKGCVHPAEYRNTDLCSSNAVRLLWRKGEDDEYMLSFNDYGVEVSLDDADEETLVKATTYAAAFAEVVIKAERAARAAQAVFIRASKDLEYAISYTHAERI